MVTFILPESPFNNVLPRLEMTHRQPIPAIINPDCLFSYVTSLLFPSALPGGPTDKTNSLSWCFTSYHPWNKQHFPCHTNAQDMQNFFSPLSLSLSKFSWNDFLFILVDQNIFTFSATASLLNLYLSRFPALIL